jgi:8-oxo-dGTP diphosphatase
MPAIVVLVNRCFVISNEGRLLIIRRSLNDYHNAGKWEVPGGKLDEGQDLSHAQEREVLEETGLLVEPTHRMVFAESRVLGDGKYKGLPYIALFSITRVVGGKMLLSDEHSEHKWVTYDELIECDLTLEVRKAAIVLKSLLS